jgi:hypothetical protein
MVNMSPISLWQIVAVVATKSSEDRPRPIIPPDLPIRKHYTGQAGPPPSYAMRFG